MPNEEQDNKQTNSGNETDSTTSEDLNRAGSLFDDESDETQNTDETDDTAKGEEGDPPKKGDDLISGGGEEPKDEDDAGDEGDGDDNSPEFDLAEVSIDSVQELLPEGYEADNEALQPFVDMVNSAQSRTELIQKSLALLAENQKQAEQVVADNWNNLQKQMKEEVRNDPELGGDKFKASLATAKEVVETYADNPVEFKQLLTMTGAGNSIHMVRFMNKMAELLPKEADPLTGEPAPTTQSRADKLFG